MTGRFTAGHWGIREIAGQGDSLRLSPFRGDPDPNPIGLDQHQPQVNRLRVRRPAVRRSWLEHGPTSRPDLRGREPFVEIDWDEALDLVAGELARVRRDHGNGAIFGGSYGWSSAGRFHHAQSQVHRFLASFGGYVSSVDTYSLSAGRVILPYVAGQIDQLHAEHTTWDVMADHTRLFVAFGGMPSKNAQISPGGVGDHMLKDGLAAMAANGKRFVNISPVRDSLVVEGAAADTVEWIPIRPNTDTALMLALARQMFMTGDADRAFLEQYCSGGDAFAAYLSGATDGIEKTPDWAERITGVPAARIRSLAGEMAANRTMLNAAFALQRADHGEQPFFALIALAAVLGQIGLPGGGFGLGYGAMNMIGSPAPRLKGPTLPQGTNAVQDFIPVARIADALLGPGNPYCYNGETRRYPDIRLVYWAGGNPYHHHQDLSRLRAAWQRPEAIFVHEQYWTATAKMADIVLPATIALERQDIGFSSRERYIVAMEQAMPPLADARDDYTVLADLAARLGCKEAFTEGLDAAGWQRRLYDACAERAGAQGIDLPTYDAFRRDGIFDLFPWAQSRVFLQAFRADPAAAPLATESGRIELWSDALARHGLADCPPHPAWIAPGEWLGAAEPGQLHLISDQPARKLHSQLDHAGHSMAGKRDGRECVDIAPEDAAARGIADDDVVTLFNARGRALAVARVTPEIMPGVLRLSTGAWLDPFDTGPDLQGNPNVLTRDRGASTLSQGCAAQSCLVRLARATTTPPPRAHDLPPFSGRPG